MDQGIKNEDFSQFAFPFNVYACLFHLEKTNFDGLHYGLFQHPGEKILEAQRHSTKLILKKLPPPPCKVLEINYGLGAAANFLTQLGYSMTVLNPDPNQFRAARNRIDHRIDSKNVDFARFQSSPDRFDVVLLRESDKNPEPLLLFNKAFMLLKPGGIVVMLDKFGFQGKTKDFEKLPFLEHVVNQARRCGFHPSEQTDLSESAISTVTFFLNGLKKHGSQLIENLKVDQNKLDALELSLTNDLKKYSEKIYRYALIVFKKGEPPKYRLSVSEKKDHENIRRLFLEVFGHEMPESFWRWKYADNKGRSVIARFKGEVVGHYGGVVRDVLWNGTRQNAVQPCDVMAHPSHRSPKGPFFLSAVTFLEKFTGYGNPFPISFGFPNYRAIRLGKLLKIYEESGPMVKVRWPSCSRRKFFLNAPVRCNKKFPDKYARKIDLLWNMMKKDFSSSLIVVRNSAYIRYRYFDHPTHLYDMILVQDRICRQPKGFLVLKPEGDAYFLLDVLGPLKNLPYNILAARRLAYIRGFKELYTIITKPHAKHFLVQDGRGEPSEFHIATNNWTSGPDPREIGKDMWLMGGDTDFL